jgi:flagellar motor switch protein FliN/FliY
LEQLQPNPSDMPAIATRQIVERLPIVLTVELGRTSVLVKDLKNLRKGQIIGLDKMVGEPLSIFANGQRLASGEVVSVAQERYGVRVIALAEEPDPAAEAPA